MRIIDWRSDVCSSDLMLANGDYYAYSAAHGKHGVSGFYEKSVDNKMKQAISVTRAGKAGKDPRVSTYELQKEIYDTVNNASTTLTLVNAAKRDRKSVV